MTRQLVAGVGTRFRDRPRFVGGGHRRTGSGAWGRRSIALWPIQPVREDSESGVGKTLVVLTLRCTASTETSATYLFSQRPATAARRNLLRWRRRFAHQLYQARERRGSGRRVPIAFRLCAVWSGVRRKRGQQSFASLVDYEARSQQTCRLHQRLPTRRAFAGASGMFVESVSHSQPARRLTRFPTTGDESRAAGENQQHAATSAMQSHS